MSEAQVVNMMLHRKLESGSQYSRLIPNYLSIRHRFELPADYSNTYDTLEFMAIWTNKYAYQFEKVANVLKGKNVLETVKNNYNFLYKHFQYKIDENLQQIYAPSAAWHYRKVGFDCKSFSVLAMSLLLCQNIEASFVKVKLPGSNDWSHVYVQIPYQGSYLIIDATTHDNKEVNFIEKHEFNMNNLKHIGLASPFMDTPYLDLDTPSLACPGQACSCNSGALSNPYSNDPYAVVVYNGAGSLNGDFSLNSFDNLSIDSFMGIFSTPISCWGGSAFSGERAQSETTKISEYFAKLLVNINNAVRDKNMILLSNSYLKFEGILFTAIKAYAAKKSEGWNKCTTESISRMQSVLNFYEKVVYVGLTAWLDKYFSKLAVGTQTFNNNDFEGVDPGFYFTYTYPNVTHTVNLYDFKLKAGVTEIPMFEFTPYVEQVASNPNSFNVLTFLQSLTKALVYFDTNGNASSEPVTQEPNTEIKPKPKNTSSSAGTFVLGTLALGGLVWGFSKMKDNGPGANKSTKN